MNEHKPNANDMILSDLREALSLLAERRLADLPAPVEPPDTLDARIRKLAEEYMAEQKRSARRSRCRRVAKVAGLALLCALTLHSFLYYNVEAYRQPIQQFFMRQTEDYDFFYYIEREEDSTEEQVIDPNDGYDETGRAYPERESFYRDGKLPDETTHNDKLDRLAEDIQTGAISFGADYQRALFECETLYYVHDPAKLQALYAYLPYHIDVPEGFSLYVISDINAENGGVIWENSKGEHFSFGYEKMYYDEETDRYQVASRPLIDTRGVLDIKETACSVNDNNGYLHVRFYEGEVWESLFWTESRFRFSISRSNYEPIPSDQPALSTLAESVERKP